MDWVERRQANRIAFLIALFELADGRTVHVVATSEVAERAGLTPQEAEEAMDYLLQRKLVSGFLDGGTSTYLTPEGQEVAERALSRPQQSVEGLPPAGNIINIHGDVNAPIQQGSGNTQSISFDESDRETLRRLVELLEQLVGSGDLNEQDAVDLRADAEAIGTQLARPEPNRGRLKAAVDSVKAVVLAAGGEATYAGVIQLLHTLHL